VLEAVTESATTAVNNDLVRQKIYDEGGALPKVRCWWLSVMGSLPCERVVVQGADGPWAEVDLNGVYSEISHQNLQLTGWEELTLWSFGDRKAIM